MSLKNLPIRAPASKVLPRKRSVGERIVATLELAALVRTLARVFGRGKRSRIPSRGGLLAIAGGGLLAAVIGVVLAKRKSGGEEASTPAPSPAPTETAAPKAESPAEPGRPDPDPDPEPEQPKAEERKSDEPKTAEPETGEKDAVADPRNDRVADHIDDTDPVPAAVDAAKGLSGNTATDREKA